MKKILFFYIPFIFLISVFLSFGILKLKIQGDIFKALPSQDPYVKLFDRIGEEFKGNMIGMVILEGKPDIFNEKTFKKIAELTEEYKKIKGVSSCLSLTDIMDIRKIEEGIEITKLVPANYIPKNKREFDSLRSYIMSKKRFKGVIVSENGKYASIIIRFSQNEDREKVAKEIKRLTEIKKGDFKVYYSGLPFTILSGSETIRKEILKLTPFAFLILFLILFLSFGDFKAVFLIFIPPALSLLWILGIMGFLNVPLSIVSNILPVVIPVVGSAYGIHLLNSYFKYGKNIKEAFNQIWIPIFMSGITTFAGFLSLIFTQLDVIKKFGIFTSIGVLFCLFFTLTFLPILLSFFKIKKIKEEIDFPPVPFMRKISEIVIKDKFLTISISLLIFLISLIFIFKIKREVNMISYFSKKDPVRITTELVMKEFGGSMPSYILFEVEDFKDPTVLKMMKYIEDEIEKYPYLKHSQSISDFIGEMNELLTGFNSIPDSKEKVENLYFLIDGKPEIEMVVSKDYKKALIQMVSGIGETKIDREISLKIEEILNKISKKYITIDVDSLPVEFREKIINDYVDFYTKIIKNSINSNDTSKIKNVLLSFFRDNLYENKKKEIAFKELDKYFGSEEAIFKIKDEKKKKIIINEIINSSNIENVLHKYFRNLKNEDVEILKEEIEEIIYEAKRKGFVEEFSKDFQDKEKLKNYLYEFTGKKIIIPYKEDLNFGKILEMNIYYSGIPIIYRRIDDNLLKSQIQSLLMVIILVFIFVTIEWRSIIGGIFSMIPILFTIIFYFGILGFFHIPLDAANVLIAPIIIGIGIDYTIHVLSKIKKEIKFLEYEEAFKKMFLETGKAVIVNALSVAFGFLVLIFGNFIPIKRFGILIFITMIISSISALFLLPKFLFLIKPKFIKK
jgi:predicted RND superfamily exporter protein